MRAVGPAPGERTGDGPAFSERQAEIFVLLVVMFCAMGLCLLVLFRHPESRQEHGGESTRKDP